MKKQKGFRVFGLTGEMGTGKSTVAKILKKHKEIKIFDCDKIAKKITFEKCQKIEEILKEKICENGKINNKKIASIIFKNPTKKQKIEKLIHPLVWKDIQKEIEKSKNKKIFIVESAIIYRIGWDRYFEKIILTECNLSKQIERIKKRSKLEEKQIRERIKEQSIEMIKNDKKIIRINTGCSLEEVKEKTELLYTELFL